MYGSYFVYLITLQ